VPIARAGERMTPPPDSAKNSAMCRCEIESLSAKISSTGIGSLAMSAGSCRPLPIRL